MRARLVFQGFLVELGRRQPGTFQGSRDASLPVVNHSVNLERLDHGVAHAEAWVERLVRVLEDDLQLASDGAHLAL